MPAKHLKATELRGLSEEKLTAMARKVGSHALQVIIQILQASTYPQQAFKTCNGILQCQKKYGKERLEAACAYALASTRVNYQSIVNILKSGQDKQALLFDIPAAAAPIITDHGNIRGAANYQ